MDGHLEIENAKGISALTENVKTLTAMVDELRKEVTALRAIVNKGCGIFWLLAILGTGFGWIVKLVWFK